jgi:threonyl-tRNA synthetase
MKILTLHCDYIKYKAIKKALKNVEDIEKELVEVPEPLVVFVAVEKEDSEKEVDNVVESVEKTAKELNATKIVVYPYAHLSSNLSNPEKGAEYLELISVKLKKKKLEVSKAPFGYYKEFELKVKGHPMSELSKEFRNNQNVVEEKYDYKQLLKEISRSRLDTSKLKDNDHRILGQKMDLFSFNDVAPGSVFWHNNGLIIYNELISFMRKLLNEYGYQEISTPQILDNKMWKISGHWEHYKNNMFVTKYENRDLGVKPMNCPGGLLVYKTKTKSYKDLPLRVAEFGVVHRQELSGVLAGLFRVIKFTQDDAHVFCAKEQLESEIEKILKLIDFIYNKTFGFEFKVELSTRPEKYMGDKKDWDFAEKVLESVLKKSKIDYKLNEGDGAFYGPKIDFHIKDSLGRSWQCGTIQLDMQMPVRFDISYVDKDNTEKCPIMLHRAIFGSVERFIGILLEHLNGALPFWLSPVQIKVVSFTDRNVTACEKLVCELKAKGFRAEADLRNTTVNDKIRDAEILRIPYIIVIGDKEEEAKTIAVRTRGEKKVKFGVKLDEFVKELDNLKN